MMYEIKQFLTSNQRLLVILEDFLSQLNFAENFRIWFFHLSLEIAIFLRALCVSSNIKVFTSKINQSFQEFLIAGNFIGK